MAKVKTSWKPGQSGNPKGGPKKGYSITEWFKNMLASNPEIRDALGKSILKKALEGDPIALRMVWSYMDGMPSQNLNLEGNVLQEIVHIYTPKKNEDNKMVSESETGTGTAKG